VATVGESANSAPMAEILLRAMLIFFTFFFSLWRACGRPLRRSRRRFLASSC
jgi:hypothetical protein